MLFIKFSIESVSKRPQARVLRHVLTGVTKAPLRQALNEKSVKKNIMQLRIKQVTGYPIHKKVII